MKTFKSVIHLAIGLFVVILIVGLLLGDENVEPRGEGADAEVTEKATFNEVISEQDGASGSELNDADSELGSGQEKSAALVALRDKTLGFITILEDKGGLEVFAAVVDCGTALDRWRATPSGSDFDARVFPDMHITTMPEQPGGELWFEPRSDCVAGFGENDTNAQYLCDSHKKARSVSVRWGDDRLPELFQVDNGSEILLDWSQFSPEQRLVIGSVDGEVESIRYYVCEYLNHQ